MKSFLIIFLFSIVIIGCSSKNAFDRFHISDVQALSEDNIQRAKLKNAESIEGLIAVVHLNEVLSEYENKESDFFYIYLHTKSTDENLTFELNGENPIGTEVLPSPNRFSYLTSSSMTWKKYFLVEFKKQENDLVLQIKSEQFSSDELLFKRN